MTDQQTISLLQAEKSNLIKKSEILIGALEALVLDVSKSTDELLWDDLYSPYHEARQILIDNGVDI